MRQTGNSVQAMEASKSRTRVTSISYVFRRRHHCSRQSKNPRLVHPLPKKQSDEKPKLLSKPLFKRLIVVENYKMLSCKCSEIRSNGSDHSARNQHYHYYQCFHPFKSSDLLATHLITNHPEVDLPQVRHLMWESNPHCMYDYKQ